MPLRFPGSRPLLGGLTAGLLLLLGVEAQQAPKPPASMVKVAAPNAAKPLTPTEKKELQALFTKLRPATLRIEQCPPNRCDDPDGVGTAFLIGVDGLALTAYHVIFQADNLSARTSDGKRYPVKVVGYDDQHDVALIRVVSPKEPPFCRSPPPSPKSGTRRWRLATAAARTCSPSWGASRPWTRRRSRPISPPARWNSAPN